MTVGPELTVEELEMAFQQFKRRCERDHRILDQQKSLRGIREVRQKSIRTMATQLGISFQAYSELEKRSASGKISINQLRKMAAALDCDVEVHFKPRSGRGFIWDLWQQLLPFAKAYPSMRSCPPYMRVGRLAAIAMVDCLPHPEIRRRLGWARKDYTLWPSESAQCRTRWPYNV